MRATVGVVGMGHVGRMTSEALGYRCQVVTFDNAYDKSYPHEAMSAADFIVVCVGTPMSTTGAADLSQVHSAFEQVPAGKPVVLRSTVPPGTCAKLAEQYGHEVIFWPEYVGETRFVVQTMDQLQTAPFQIFGAEKSPALSAWIDLMAECFGPLVRIYQVTATEAELIKYMENCFFAVKTTFVNEFRSLAETLGLDWQSVREGWLLDPRMGRDHSDAFTGAPGYSGRCLPKDVAAILHSADKIGAPMPLLAAVQDSNAARLARDGQWVSERAAHR